MVSGSGEQDKIFFFSYVLAGPASSTFASPPPGSPSSPSGTTRNSTEIFSLKIVLDFYKSYTETSKAYKITCKKIVQLHDDI